VEQLVARWAHNPKVTSSSLVPATMLKRPKGRFFYAQGESVKRNASCRNHSLAVTFQDSPLCMEYHVFVLFSPAFNQIYIGFSHDVEGRLLSHNVLAKKGWTLRYRPWILIHKESFPGKKEAMIREKQLKSAKGREWIRQNLFPA
jgi:putative endonuclease